MADKNQGKEKRFKLVLLYPPFCTPSVMPYSISYIKGYLNDHLDADVVCLDLNAKYHRLRFKEHYRRLEEFKKAKRTKDGRLKAEACDDYARLLEDFDKESRPVYSEANKEVVEGREPKLLDEMLKILMDEMPDAVAFSLVYNSQCFFAKALMEQLSKQKIPLMIGGPADTSKLALDFQFIHDEVELSQHLISEHGVGRKPGRGVHDRAIPDFSDYDPADYLTIDTIYPVRSCTGCYYRQCAFCTHHKDSPYTEHDLDEVIEVINRTGARNLFFIDDMISRDRLMAIAGAIGPLGVKWACQLKPTRQLLGSFEDLHKSGLRAVFWGVESGSQRVLNLMRKGTNVADIEKVLSEGHDAGIINSTFIMFGFPGEKKEEFIETIEFLKRNTSSIDLVSTSVFGLQKGSKVYKEREHFGIVELREEERTVLGESITYSVKEGMQHDEAKAMRTNYIKTLKKLDRVPRIYNYFKEQLLLI